MEGVATAVHENKGPALTSSRTCLCIYQGTRTLYTKCGVEAVVHAMATINAVIALEVIVLAFVVIVVSGRGGGVGCQAPVLFLEVSPAAPKISGFRIRNYGVSGRAPPKAREATSSSFMLLSLAVQYLNPLQWRALHSLT